MSNAATPAGRRAGAAAATLLAGALLLLGCGVPPELRQSPGATAPGTPVSGPATANSAVPPSTTPVTPPASPSGPAGPSFAEEYAVDCAGAPSGAQVLARVRQAGLLPTRLKATVRIGPLCAGSWQYTVFNVSGNEPLVVVTEGSPRHLDMVTAGSDVCSIPVRVQAPVGIRTAAGCS